MASMYDQLLEEDPYRKFMMKNYGEQAVDSAQSKFTMPEMGQSAKSSYESVPNLGVANKAQAMPQAPDVSTGSSLAQAGTAGATAGLATGNPYIAAATIGGSLLAQSMANDAQAKQAQRQRAVQIAQEQAQGEQNAYRMLMDTYRG